MSLAVGENYGIDAGFTNPEGVKWGLPLSELRRGSTPSASKGTLASRPVGFTHG